MSRYRYWEVMFVRKIYRAAGVTGQVTRLAALVI